MTNYNDLEVELFRSVEPDYRVSLKFMEADGASSTLMEVGPEEITLPFDELRATLQTLDDGAYGRQLRDAVFVGSEIQAKFGQWIARTPLRIRLRLDPTDRELHELRWEMLRGPDDETLSSKKDLFYSRYLPSGREVALRPERDDLRALIVLVNPSPEDREEYNLSQIDTDFDRRAEALAPIPCDSLSSADGPVTMNKLLAKLKEGEQKYEGYDIVYLVCHGAMVRGRPHLLLELESDEEVADKSHFRSGEVLTRRMREELETLPRLMLLASCASAGKGDGNALTSLGPLLAKAGVPAVIAMQGYVQIQTADSFAPVFFKSLTESGLVDSAMQEARSHIRNEKNYADWWMPVLFMRLANGRIWYRPGFDSRTVDEEELWQAVTRNMIIQDSYDDEDPRSFCTPILGPGLTSHLFGRGQSLARNWAREDQFPLEPMDRDELARVLQYSKVKRGGEETLRRRFRQQMKDELQARYKHVLGDSDAKLDEMIRKLWQEHLQHDPTEPHNILAGLPFTCYITTNPTDVLEVALEQQGRRPVSMVYQWRDMRGRRDSQESREHVPTYEEPLVFHLLGHTSIRDSMVLTEDDYFDYMINFIRNWPDQMHADGEMSNRIPHAVYQAITDAALVFLGFRMYRWDFRIIFRSLLSQPSGGGWLDRYTHAAAQISPQDGVFLNPAGAEDYLTDYFVGRNNPGNLKLNIYWGEARDFLNSLKREWAEKAEAEGIAHGK